MKKKVTWLIAIIIAVAIAVGVSVYRYHKLLEVKSFSISDYEEYISEYDEYMELYKVHYPELYITHIDPFTDADTLRATVDKLWVEIYGEEQMKTERPYLVFYDEKNDAWRICGTFKKSIFVSRNGGVANMIVKSDGEVLAAWHGK